MKASPCCFVHGNVVTIFHHADQCRLVLGKRTGLSQISLTADANLLQESTQSTMHQPFHSTYTPQEQGDGFVACLDVQQFSPEDLAVKVSGDKLVVAGRHEVKSGEGSSGNYRHSCQEFREEMQLPRDVDPQSVSCSMTTDGKLKIKAQRRALPAADERHSPTVKWDLISKAV
ncbi:unnamed protein product [Lampetra fluviatilis]